MKKLFLILCLLSIFAIPSVCSADTARAIAVGGQVEQIVAVADGSSGIAMEVDASGNAYVEEQPKDLDVSNGSTAAAISGAATIYGFVVRGVSAGDYALIYDALTATGTEKFDIYVGTAADTKVVILPAGGVSFSTGVSTTCTDGDVMVSTIYKQ